jgi:hypothetical protein
MLRRGLLIVGLFALAFVPRLLLIALRADALEAWEYETLAVNIASGTGYVINRFGHDVLAFGDGNLYSFLAGALYAATGHHPLVLAAVQAVLASLAIPVLYLIAERPFGPARALLGAALAAVHPGLMAYTLKLHPLGLDVLLLTVLVWWTLQRRWSGYDGVLAGITLGLNMMTRPTLFIAGILGWCVRWRTHPRELRPILAAVGVGLLIVTPWVGRNCALLGQPLLISTSFEDIWKGNNAAATGSSYVGQGTTVFDVAPPQMQQQLRESDELGANAVFAAETVKFIEWQPEQFASLVARKFFYFWWLPAEAGLLYPAPWLSAYKVYALVMYVFAVIGVIGIVRHGRPRERELLRLLATIGLTLAVVHALAYVEGRHRWVLEPLLLLLVARGVFSMATWLAEHRRLSQVRIARWLKDRSISTRAPLSGAEERTLSPRSSRPT